MTTKKDFGAALRNIRIQKQLPQESLGPSQSFISSIERGIRSPTLQKVEQLAVLLEISPLTLLAFAYLEEDQTVDDLLITVREELRSLGK
ncbi:helix-turn-helix domain-containing protein [Pseudomonas sp. PS02290]|uniref:helix-turn-helix domain-containing protein n=1 Tax=Pseudomonas sp. PS02290 TaxID=2991430 RepID=UPI00249C822F|nr:helix-turn-helix transcriptional regulator [Pseudomonas sp. PS02290]